MRILHVIPTISPVDGGPTHAVRRMAAIAAAAGHMVTIASTRGTDVSPMGPSEDGGVAVFRASSVAAGAAGTPSLASYLRKAIPLHDVVHVHGVFAFTTAATCAMSRRARVPYVLRPLGQLDPWSLAQKRVKKAIYYRAVGRRDVLGARILHVTSRLERDNVRRLEPAARCVVVPNSVVVPAAVPERRPAEELRVLFLSRLHPKKGVEALLDALARLQGEGVPVRATIAGSGQPAYEESLRSRCRGLGLERAVTFVGFAQGERKAQLFHEADVFVLPSHQENFGVAVAEALAEALPVVVSDQVAVAEDIARAGAGSVIAVGDLGELARAIASYRDPALRARHGGAGRALARERYSDEAASDALMGLYRVAVGKADPARSS